LNVKAGSVIHECMPRHRAAEFLRFARKVARSVPHELDVHFILDNLSTHKTPVAMRYRSPFGGSGSQSGIGPVRGGPDTAISTDELPAAARFPRPRPGRRLQREPLHRRRPLPRGRRSAWSATAPGLRPPSSASPHSAATPRSLHPMPGCSIACPVPTSTAVPRSCSPRSSSWDARPG
jgi:hypothetical protein